METSIVKLNPELLAMFAGGSTDASLDIFKNEIFLQKITIAGTGYCENIEEVFPQLQEQTVLSLQRDPKNEHDELAIGVYFKGERIGWVPRKQNEVVARLMDAGKKLFVRITSLQEESDKWKHIEGDMLMID